MSNATEEFFDELIGYLDLSTSEEEKVKKQVLPNLISERITNPFEIQRRINGFVDGIRTPYVESNLSISVETGGFEGNKIDLPDRFYQGPLEILIESERDTPEEGFVNWDSFKDIVMDSLNEDERNLVSPLLIKRNLEDRYYDLKLLEKSLPELKNKINLILKRKERYKLKEKLDVDKLDFDKTGIGTFPFPNIDELCNKYDVMRKFYNCVVQGASQHHAYKIATKKNKPISSGNVSYYVRTNFPSLNANPVNSSLVKGKSLFLERIVLLAAQKGLSVHQASQFSFVSTKTVRRVYYAAEIDFFTDEEKEFMNSAIERGCEYSPGRQKIILGDIAPITVSDRDFTYYKEMREKFARNEN